MLILFLSCIITSIFDKPVVISTSTIALQEQIFSDIAVASDLINYHPEVINAKGQNHYVCRKRAAQLFSDRHLPGEIIDQIRKGASERIDFGFDIDNRLWDQINTSGYSARICNRCCFSQDCHYSLQYKQITLRLNITSDDDILQRLDEVENK